MANDYYDARAYRRQRFGLTSAERENANDDRIEAGFERLPPELRLKRGLVGTGMDVSDTPNAVQIVTGDVALGTYTAYERGQAVGWIVEEANTGAATISVDGGPVVPLVDSALAALDAGDLVQHSWVEARFTGTAFTIVAVTATTSQGAATQGWTRGQIEQIVRDELRGRGGGHSTGTVYLAVAQDADFTAAELAAGTSAERFSLTIPVWPSGTRYMAVAYPAIDGTLKTVHYGGGAVNQVNGWEQLGNLMIDGVDCHVYRLYGQAQHVLSGVSIELGV